MGLSKKRRPVSREISSRDFTYYWSGMSNGARLKGVTIGISSKLQPSIVVITLFGKRIMRLRLKHTLGFMSLFAVYIPTEMHEADERMFFANLISYWTSAPSGTHSLSWMNVMLPLVLEELATNYVLVPIALVPGPPTAFTFSILKNQEDL